MKIEAKRRQVVRARNAALIAWVLLLLLPLIGGVLELTPESGIVFSAISVAAYAALPIALFLTASWYVRGVSARFDAIQQALAAIQEQLGDRHSTDSGDRIVPS